MENLEEELKKIESPSIISGTRVIVRYKNMYLVLKYHPAKQQDTVWDMPGGTIRTGEDAVTCARRELKEETGISGSNLVYLGSQTTDYGNIKKIYHGFFTRVSSPQVVLSQEHVDFRWLAPSQFNKLDHFKDAPIYIGIIKRFKLADRV